MKQKKRKIPFIASLLFRLFLPKEDNIFLSGDFKEIYLHLFKIEGRFAAWRWFWWQILISVPHFISQSILWRMSMFKNYFKIALRNLKKYKGYSFINITGIACSILINITIF